MSLTKIVEEQHVVTETDHGDYCWTCTLESGADVPHPCPTIARAVELEAVTPLEIATTESADQPREF